ncbi:MAG: glycosyltransferase [Planctomycetaceae bacterium]|nr:glycosyltransferase [Planctomycetaceae bacterium]
MPVSKIVPNKKGYKVLVVDPYGGNEAVLLQALEAGSVESVYVCLANRLKPGIPTTTKVFQAPENARGPFRASGLRLLNPLRRAWLLAKQVVCLRGVVAEVKPDIIIAIDIELGLPVALKARGVPVAGISEGSDILVVPRRSEKQKRNLCRWLRKSRGMIVYTKHQEDALRLFQSQNMPIWIRRRTQNITPYSESFELVPSQKAHEFLPVFRLGAWRDCAVFAPLANPLARQVPLVLCLRGSSAVYRPEVLVEACARAYRRAPFTLRMAAASDDVPRLLTVAQAHGLPKDAIAFVTERIPYERMPLEYGAATVVVQAILDESLGYTAIEAMACGRVMVQPDSEVAREVLSPEQQALLSGPSAESLAEKMALALNDHNLRRNIEDANRRHALKYYDRAKVLPRVGAGLQAWLAGIIQAYRAGKP